MELEQDNKTNFLDITINKLVEKHDFSIYRKQCDTDMTLHTSSLHPYQHKLAALKQLIVFCSV